MSQQDSQNNGTAYLVSDHFDGKRFFDPDGGPAGGSLWELLRWKLFGGPVPPWPSQVGINTVSPNLPPQVAKGHVAATFIGHCTFLLQFPGGLNVLTDPVWSERIGPVSFVGPSRAQPPALAWDDLPPIHLVLVSHSHYDHLDVPTLRRLHDRFAPQFITGLGNRRFLEGVGLKSVVELDWWEKHVLEQAWGGQPWSVTFTPAHHWAKRSFFDTNTTLWGGFYMQPVEGSGPRVLFAGDSGWGQAFARVRERLGAPALALLPIGAYEPRWFMKPHHMNPEDAVQAHLVLEAKQSLAMHFGTFRLADEGIDEPAQDLAQSLQRHGIEPEQFRVLRFGETWLG